MVDSIRPGLLVSLTILLTIIQVGHSAIILFYIGVGSYSHKIAVWPLVDELALRGHTVTVISGHPQKSINPKVTTSTEVNPKALRHILAGKEDTILDKRMDGSQQGDGNNLPQFGKTRGVAVLTSPEFKAWTAKTSKIDLVITDGLFNECGLGMAYKYIAKFIHIPTSSVTMWFPESTGLVPEISWIPDMQFYFDIPMTFMNRVVSTLRPLYWQYWLRQTNYFPKMESFMRKELDIPDMSPLKELERNTSLVFLSTHYSIEYARSLPPFYVPIGGMHIVESNQKLPKEMSDFVEGSGPGGVIYVSFGSAAKASKLPAEIKSVLYEVFGSFKSQRFIWRFDIDRPKDLPDNIMTVKWAPQQELLAHRKVKAFTSHTGYGSIQECTYYGVPMIVFPLFAEQVYNANIIDQMGCGIKLEIVGITKEQLRNAIKNILEDGSLFKGRPMKPLETAVWWTENVLSHKDVSTLKSLTGHQTWYERRLLDVWLFIFSAILIVALTLFKIIHKCVCASSQPKMKLKSKTS